MAGYILGESADETARLRSQTARHPVADRLRWAGLRSGMSVVDAGCGPGLTTRIISELVGETGTVVGFDASRARLDAAEAQRGAQGAAMRFIEGDIYAPPLPPASADFVFSQFVFEYLERPREALRALVELLRPGGILLLCDVDGVFNTNWPEPPEVTEGLRVLRAALARTGFDPEVGRKLFAWVKQAGLSGVEVRLEPLVFAGRVPEAELENWRQRFAGAGEVGRLAFGGQEGADGFVARYLAMLQDDEVLKYTTLVNVRGQRQ